MKPTKAQSEILGLLVIVFILLFLGMVYLRFASLSQGSSYTTLRTNVDTHNLLQALVTLQLTDVSIREMSATCAVDASLCPELQHTLEDILTAGLKPLEDFHFTLKANEETLLDFGPCKKGIVASFPYVKEGILFDATLLLCASTTN